MSSSKSGFRYAWATACLLAGTVCLLALSSSPAAAGTFTALTCHDSAGDGVGTQGWSVGSATGQYITYSANCANGSQGWFGLGMGPNPTANYYNGDGNTMTYSVPTGLSIISYSLQLHAFGGPCTIQSGQCADGFGDVYVNHTGQSDPNYDYRNLGYGAQETTVSVGGLSGVNYVNVGVGCDPGQDLSYPCPGSNSGGPEAEALVSSGSFTLHDSTVPSVANVSGSLIAQGVLSGTDTISFTASDSGGGVYSATVLVDGQQVVREVPNTNEGVCANLTPSSPTMTFTSPQPCPSAENISIPVNTSKLSAGQHHLQVTIEDAAGEEATAYDGLITVGGPSSGSPGVIGPGSPAALRGAPNGTNASDQAKLTARWARTPKTALTEHYGAREHITGTLTTTAGQPITGALLDVYATPDYQGAHPQSLGTTQTSATGAWTLTLPATISSATLSFAYRSHVNDTVAVATVALKLSVHAGLTLHVAPRVTSVGRKIYFSGTLHGAPIPSGGKQLVLEASSGAEWIQFDTIGTDAKGRYHASYRFKFPGPVTYHFRVVSPYESNFPFLDGISNKVAIHEL